MTLVDACLVTNFKNILREKNIYSGYNGSDGIEKKSKKNEIAGFSLKYYENATKLRNWGENWIHRDA